MVLGGAERFTRMWWHAVLLARQKAKQNRENVRRGKFLSLRSPSLSLCLITACYMREERRELIPGRTHL